MLEPYWNVDYSYNHSHRQQFEYLNLTHLSDRLAFIHDSQLGIRRDRIQNDADLIRTCRKNTGRLPVLVLDSNPYDVDTYTLQLNQFLDQSEYFVFHSDIRPEKSVQPNHAPWPSWLLFQHHTPDYQQHPKDKRISFLSGVPRVHRLKLFHEIKPLVRQDDVVVVNKFCHYVPKIPTHWIEQLPWANRDEYIDTPQTEANAYNQGTNIHPAYRACVNITGETIGNGNQVLPSEKTWKAYRSGCLVVNYGVKGMVTALENFGLGIWKDYDLDLDADSKIPYCVELFQRDDIIDIYQQNKDMVEHNRQLVMSKKFCLNLGKMAVNKLTAMI